MRKYIFEFDQEIVLRLGLKLNELLFLTLAIYFNDGCSPSVKPIDGNKKREVD